MTTIGNAWGGKAVAHVPEEWRRVRSVITRHETQHGTNGEQIVNVVTLTEPGLYLYLLQSDSPLAHPFQLQRHPIRVIKDEKGEPWFLAPEVCRILGYARPNDAVTAHCKHAKILKHGEIPYLEINPRGVYIIPESDLYRLTMRSQLPGAVDFQDWVIETVLPAIRKTGGYIMGEENIIEVGRFHNFVEQKIKVPNRQLPHPDLLHQAGRRGSERRRCAGVAREVGGLERIFQLGSRTALLSVNSLKR